MSLETWGKGKEQAADEGSVARYISSAEDVTPSGLAATYGIPEENIRRAPSSHLPPLFIPPINKEVCGTIIGSHYMERRPDEKKPGDKKSRDKVLVIEVDLDESLPDLGIEKGPAAIAGYHVVLVDELLKAARMLFIDSIKREIDDTEALLSEATEKDDKARMVDLNRKLADLNRKLADADNQFMRTKLDSILRGKHICVKRLPRTGQAYPYEVKIFP